MEKEIKILDHGFVRLIDSMGTDEDIISAARMSTGKGFISWEEYEFCESSNLVASAKNLEVKTLGHIMCTSTHKNYPRGDAGLLEHLYKSKHMTPFEMCEMVIEVQAPIFVAREWMRHRTASYNEFSARYSVMPNIHYVPTEDRLTPKTSSNKQESSLDVKYVLDPPHTLKVISREQELIYANYEAMLDYGVPKETARIDTPVSRYTKFRAKANLRNWLSFLMLRKANDAQWEIRVYADAVGKIIEELWPRTYALFMEYDFNGLRLSATEKAYLKELLGRANAEAFDGMTPAIKKALLKKFGILDE